MERLGCLAIADAPSEGKISMRLACDCSLASFPSGGRVGQLRTLRMPRDEPAAEKLNMQTRKKKSWIIPGRYGHVANIHSDIEYHPQSSCS